MEAAGNQPKTGADRGYPPYGPYQWDSQPGKQSSIFAHENGVRARINGKGFELGFGSIRVCDEKGRKFKHGDFVWGKIRSHPWWPGRIYDKSEASEDALKLKKKNKHLVAYFGDDTFAWCDSSQLKPFEDNFEFISRQSTSRSFSYAVKVALDEIGRLVEQKLNGLDRPLAFNSGIREGVLVPQGRINKLITQFFRPVEFLYEMKRIAGVRKTNTLEFTVSKSCVESCYSQQGVYCLPVYHDPQPIPGLDYYYRKEEHLLGGPRIFPSNETFEGIEISEGKTCHKIKEKSMAEIIGVRAQAEEEKVQEAKLALWSMLKKRREGEKSVIPSSSSQMRKKPRLKNNDDHDPYDFGEASDHFEDREEFDRTMSPRERKKSKYLSAPYININQSPRKKQTEPFKGVDITSPPSSNQDHRNIVFSESVNVCANDALCGIRSAACSPRYVKENNSVDVDMVDRFFSVFRSSVYHDGFNYHGFNENQPAIEAKAHHSDEYQKSQTTEILHEEDLSLNNQATTSWGDVKVSGKQCDEKASSAALFVSFGRESSLPTKNDLIIVYSRFGVLNMEGTDVLSDEYCARVVFENAVDAEAAFESSQLVSPFGEDTLGFELFYLSPEPEGNEEATQSTEVMTDEKACDEGFQLKYIREKLQLMSSIVENSDEKTHRDMKSRLGDEMEGLLKMINTVWSS